MPKIEKAGKTGFCFGVKRAINLLEKVAGEQGGIETLGAVVHNQQVLQKLAEIGVKIINDIGEIEGGTVVTSSHGISPELEEELHNRNINVISTTCPFVRRAQVAAHRLAKAGFFVIVYGDSEHPEVKGILGCAKGRGLATLNETPIASLDPTPRRIGILSQTTQVPALFTKFTKRIIDLTLTQDSEIRIIDTICHDIPDRQAAALELAQRADLMLVVGGRNSANTNRLAELCAQVTETHHIETAAEIETEWIKGKNLVGVTAGASTAEENVEEVIKRLEEMSA
jgi:4-hydroxy-3-methylbut-2-enyl diphosphate reductase